MTTLYLLPVALLLPPVAVAALMAVSAAWREIFHNPGDGTGGRRLPERG